MCRRPGERVIVESSIHADRSRSLSSPPAIFVFVSATTTTVGKQTFTICRSFRKCFIFHLLVLWALAFGHYCSVHARSKGRDKTAQLRPRTDKWISLCSTLVKWGLSPRIRFRSRVLHPFNITSLSVIIIITLISGPAVQWGMLSLCLGASMSLSVLN